MMDQPFFLPSVIIGLVSVPLILGLIPRNRIYGVRTRKSLSDDNVWYPVNRLAGFLLLAANIGYLFFAMQHPMSGTRDPRFSLWLTHLAVFAGPLLIALLFTSAYARRL
jgi:uncharacterized membrane protein